MTAPSQDLAPSQDGQRQQWDGVAAGWRKWWRTIENGARHVSERMLDLAEVGPGKRVLDIATGVGEPALSAASRVGPSGRVVATDFSPRMLEIARDRAASLGLTNVELLEADAERLDFPEGSFDAVLWRWGLPTVPTPLDTLAGIRRMLAPDGSFATAIWEPGPKSRPLASLAAAVAQELFELASPRPEAPSPPGSAQDLLEREMLHAGFLEVYTEEMRLVLEFPSTDACAQYLKDVSPELAALLSDKSPAEEAEFRQRLGEKLRPYVGADGSVRIPNVTILAVGRR